jgi:hypothetical protein
MAEASGLFLTTAAIFNRRLPGGAQWSGFGLELLEWRSSPVGRDASESGGVSHLSVPLRLRAFRVGRRAWIYDAI